MEGITPGDALHCRLANGAASTHRWPSAVAVLSPWGPRAKRPRVSRPDLSVVIPVFNEVAVIPELGKRLAAVLEALGCRWEVVFVDDGSTDGSTDLVRQLCSSDARSKLVVLSRNFGHQSAITAGMDYAHGDAVVIMDADLQDPPEVIGELLARFREGFDVVYGVRKRRAGETLLKRWTAALFYRALRAMVGVSIPPDAGDFRLLSRRVVLALGALRETHRFVRGMVAWVGFRQTAVYYDRAERFAGATHYPFRKMLRFALDGVAAFSSVPLKLVTWLGIASGLIGVAVATWAAYVRLVHTAYVGGWTTIMVAVCLGSSAQLLMTAILGEYIGRIHDEVKRRPLYLVDTELNAKRRDEP
jgi:polyisoprenyl-phosphate glycosyltransferase